MTKRTGFTISAGDITNAMGVHRIHPEKKGIRVFGVAESYRRSQAKSTLAGIVMRKDMVIDGIVFDNATAGGDDATDKILSMYNSLDRNDINCIMLGGLVISMYNIIDGDRISRQTRLPVIGITFEDSEGIEDSIKAFTKQWQKKIEQYLKLGSREKIKLKTDKHLFIRRWGISEKSTKSILDYFTLQGAIPEPIRVAKLAARAASLTRKR